MEYRPGSTNTYAAFNVARTQCFNTAADRPDVPNGAFLLTDGYPNTPDDAEALAKSASEMLKNPTDGGRSATVYR